MMLQFRAHNGKWCGRVGPHSFHGQQSEQRQNADEQSDQRRLGDMTRHTQDVSKKACLCDVDSEQLWDLIEHDDHSDACLEAGEHRS